MGFWLFSFWAFSGFYLGICFGIWILVLVFGLGIAIGMA
jgi:hypothetical protein